MSAYCYCWSQSSHCVGPLSTMSDPLSPPTPPVLVSHASPSASTVMTLTSFFLALTILTDLFTLETFKIIMSLESFHDQSDQYPHVVAQFHSDLEVCNCVSGKTYHIYCDVIYFHKVADVVLKRIYVTVYTPNISGIVFLSASNIRVQSTTIYSRSSNTCAFSILVYQAESVQVNLVSAYNFRIGVFMKDASNVWITNITTQYNNQDGIQFVQIYNTEITNTTTTKNRN